MTDDPSSAAQSDNAEASVRHRRLSWIWLIPMASLVIGGWLIWSTLSRRGPSINVVFETAQGLRAGQSEVRFKDIQMGTVESFDLVPDRTRVVMHLRMTSKAEPLLTEGAQFWVVKPRVFGGDIVGLNTLVSGSYLEMSPGDPGKSAEREFVGLDNPPALATGSSGRIFHLTTARLASLSIGSPVFFREVEVGKVTDWKLTGMAENVTLQVFINAPYDQWVRDDSRFWNTSGISLQLGAGGLRLQVNSVKSALLGGITFETPATSVAAIAATDRAFTLYSNEETAQAMTAVRRYSLITYLTGSMGGLAVGAPVMLIGSRVGEVMSIQLQFDSESNTPRARVGFLVELDTVSVVGSNANRELSEGLRALVANGLRTKLKGGNLLTGQKQLSLEIDKDAPAAQIDQEDGVFVIPSNGDGSGIDELSATANQLLAKVSRMPFQEIGQNLNGSLAGVSDIMNGRPLKDALVRLSGTLAAAQDLVRHVDAGATPALRRLPAIASELQDALSQVKELTASLSAGSRGNGKLGRDLDLALGQVAEAALSVRMVADLLSRHPEALIRGRAGRATE